MKSALAFGSYQASDTINIGEIMIIIILVVIIILVIIIIIN